MEFTAFNTEQSQAVIRLFSEVFTTSEGADAGGLITQLVTELIEDTARGDLTGFVALQGDVIAGCIFFSRLNLSNDKTAFILSPVAVATAQQRQGIGQQLIRYGLDALKAGGADWVFTYGDPDYYAGTGFEPISESVVKAPQTLSYPHGWLAQSLGEEPVTAVAGTAGCVAALDRQVYW